ncbi:MAG: beta-galactosidase trimerization domain-containing protein, partial [Pseudomonadota bacterium]
WAAQPQGQGFDYFALILDVYRALRRAGLNVDILPPETSDFAARRLVLIPGLLAWTPELRRAVERFKGVCLVGPRTGSRTATFVIPGSLGPDVPGLDCVISRTETVRPDMPMALEGGGALTLWRDCLEGSAPVIERTTDGLPARMGTERLQVLAGWPEAEAMYRIVAERAGAAGLPVLDLPPELRVRDLGPLRFAFNYGTEPVDLAHAFPGEAGVLPPAGVVWRRRG